ncbi:hypothetical protein CHU_1524 [Cytophaga hutchinsonii ATCC 33406]|uniref:Uncharacterized protein n=2 Tax=Cytophaga hutchinsonii TaxID=985 RepID=A0A6N4SR05_CYTH3|nr:hypothetical protein CHU_1524 [Cytophaga hutchinsonii ATCC 33406]
MNNFKIRAYMKRIIFFMALLCSVTAFSKSDTKYGELKNAALVTGNSVAVAGSRYTPAGLIPLNTRNFWVEDSYGLVKLSLPVGAQTTSGSATVVVKITYKTEGATVYETTVENNVSLTVNVDNVTAMATDASYYLAKGAHNIVVEVISVSNTANFSDLTLCASVVTQSFDKLTFSDIPQGLAHNTVLTAGGSLPVFWTSVPQAESYELEWTYISNQGNAIGEIKTFAEIEIPRFYFRNNSSRVVVSDTLYQIPLVYEAGYILYRVRAVGKAVVNSTPVWTKSNWTYLDNGSVTSPTLTHTYPVSNAYLYSGLENNLNWQSSLSFAEEGKHKVVVSYHDGSSRNRQAVTRINTDGRAVVGETLYDFNGRPIIQTLPVPVKKDSLGYYPNFNVVDGQTSMHKEDITNINPATCDPAGAKFSTTTGASNYYSPANSFGTTGNTGADIINKELIPDAKKYPYAQTVYTPDNTGRIAAQSGMGESNFLGSTHETKYMYATPLQAELCRLFGTQVGNAAHYKKNAVIDPNGQVSVSYLDLDGKVIATALAGGSPDNVKSLGNANTRSINEDLIKTSPMSNLMAPDSLSKIFNKKFIVTSEGIDYDFAYNGTFGFYDIPCKSAGSYMHIDGVVDVTLTLKDKCGAVLFSTTRSTASGNTGAKKTVTIDDIPTSGLNEGEYQITKQAVINEEKLAAYTQSYLASPCAKTLADFQAEEAVINTADCNMTCQTCQAEIKRLKDLNYLTDEQLDDINGLCASICDTSYACRASLNAMKVDMSPDGQYGEVHKNTITMPQNTFSVNTSGGSNVFAGLDNIDINHENSPDNSELHPELFPLSIFNPNNRLPLGSYLNVLQPLMGNSKEYWRYPVEIRNTGDVIPRAKNYQILKDASNPVTLGGNTVYEITEYKEANGDIAYVYVQKLIDYDNNNAERFFPEIQNTAKALEQLTPVDADLNLYKIPVRYLLNLSDFINQWKSHWAYNLLPYHPEYPYYVACMAQAKSNDFEYKILNTNLAEARAQGFIDPTTNLPTVFEKEGSSNGHLKLPPGTQIFYTEYMNNTMENYYNQGVSMAIVANRLVHCPNGTPETTPCGVIDKCDKTTIVTEEEWTTYRALYISAKQKFLKKLDMIKSVNQGYYNGCIGHADYIRSPDAWYFDMVRPQVINATYKFCPPFNWARNRCATWNIVNYPATIPSYLAPNQICFIGNAKYFRNKQQHFYPSGISNTYSSEQAGNCPEVTYDDENDPNHTNPIVSLIPCASDLTDLQDAATLDAERLKYELCGLCPLASDLEALLMQLKNNNKLIVAAGTSVSCPNSSVVLGESLKRKILDADITNPVIYWKSTLGSGNKVLTGIIQRGSTDVYTVTLTVPADKPYTFDDLLSLCCLTVSNTSNNAFTIKATFKKNSVYADVLLTGVITTLNLKDCDILPKCVLTDDAKNVADFLNILSASGQLETTTPVALFAGIDNTSSDDYTANVNKYFDVVLSILNISSEGTSLANLSALNPSWSVSTQSSAGLSGKITYYLPGPNNTQVENNVMIHLSYGTVISSVPLTLPNGNAHTFPDRARQFLSLGPVPYVPCTGTLCNKEFNASMISITGNQFESRKILIYTPSLIPVRCTTVIPATVNRK